MAGEDPTTSVAASIKANQQPPAPAVSPRSQPRHAYSTMHGVSEAGFEGPVSDWLVPEASWVLDTEVHRSSALAEEGLASNLLSLPGVWHSAQDDTTPWVMFDLGATLELDKIELTHQADHTLKPKECEWQFLRRNFWVCAAKFEIAPEKEKHFVEFRATAAQQWKLVVHSTHNKSFSPGVCIQQVRLHGITLEQAEAERRRQAQFMVDPEGRPGRAVSE